MLFRCLVLTNNKLMYHNLLENSERGEWGGGGAVEVSFNITNRITVKLTTYGTLISLTISIHDEYKSLNVVKLICMICVEQ